HGSGAVILPAANAPPPITSAPRSNNTGLVPRFGITISSSSTATAGAGLIDFGGRSDAALGGRTDFSFAFSTGSAAGTTDTAFGEIASVISTSTFGSSRTMIGGGRTDAMSTSARSSSCAEGGGSEIVMGTSIGGGGATSFSFFGATADFAGV